MSVNPSVSPDGLGRFRLDLLPDVGNLEENELAAWRRVHVFARHLVAQGALRPVTPRVAGVKIAVFATTLHRFEIKAYTHPGGNTILFSSASVHDEAAFEKIAPLVLAAIQHRAVTPNRLWEATGPADPVSRHELLEAVSVRSPPDPFRTKQFANGFYLDLLPHSDTTS